jgi:hypothetical protein
MDKITNLLLNSKSLMQTGLSAKFILISFEKNENIYL